MENCESNLEEKASIEDLILPCNTSDNTDRCISESCPSTLIKDEILNSNEKTGQNSNEKLSPTNMNLNVRNTKKENTEICLECGLAIRQFWKFTNQ